jgi:hypothetical protein
MKILFKWMIWGYQDVIPCFHENIPQAWGLRSGRSGSPPPAIPSPGECVSELFVPRVPPVKGNVDVQPSSNVPGMQVMHGDAMIGLRRRVIQLLRLPVIYAYLCMFGLLKAEWA